uniref:Arrestin-like N-terminal domain-containing protein n=1 Tax=Mycena chlorophos TaxID=658473 RepID=A0ABQ0LXH1_MYCCL|nr:predicted protein [Mycena chlorophos]
MAAPPPNYVDTDVDALAAAVEDLPAYDGPAHGTPAHNANARADGDTPFTYHLKPKSKDSSWAWWGQLTVNGNARLSGALAPTILQGTPVSGSVQLDLRDPESIAAVQVVLRGETRGGSPDDGIAIPTVFLEVKKELWNASQGDPNQPGAKASSKAKLKGEYKWPFSFDLPTQITKGGKAYRLPHSFGTGRGYFTLQYLVELHIVRPKLHFGRDEKLPVTFTYFTLIPAAQPSPLRALAYQENSPLLGPDADPEGWTTKVFVISGRLFSTRDFSYTRSASIPVALTIESEDSEAVDVLSAPGAPILVLECTTQQNAQNYRTTTEPVMKAVWWPAPGQPKGHLMGELHLRGNLHPSTNFAHYGFRVQYSVVLFPFQAVGFKQDVDGGFEPLKGSRQVVEITTRFAQGPRPKTYSPVPVGANAKNDAITLR